MGDERFHRFIHHSRLEKCINIMGDYLEFLGNYLDLWEIVGNYPEVMGNYLEIIEE